MRRLRRGLRWFGLGCTLSFAVTACGGGGSSTPMTVPSAIVATAAPTATPTVAPADVAYACPSSDGASSVARTTTVASEAVRRSELRQVSANAAVTRTQALAVTYDARTMAAGRPQIVARETRLGASLSHEYAFTRTGVVTRLLAVPQAKLAAAAAQLRAQPGVKSVSVAGALRYPLTTAESYFTSEPYFNGFASPVAPTATSTIPPATYHVAPYDESASVPGQWDMHAVGLNSAWAYSRVGNGSTVTNPRALGAAAIKIAVIDSGADTLHPKLVKKVAYQRCFITNPAGVQSTSDFSTDELGHGTNVTGLAGAQINSGIGFVGAGGYSTLYSYRVFPTPDDACATPDSSDAQCGADTADLASAIADAVAQGVNVISMSLGGGTCTNGADPDTLEGNAIAEALAANIIVVAAAGNGGTAGVNAPGCDTGVIAVGASALSDGAINGSGVVAGSPATPVEYVASYSSYGSPAASVRSTTAWGIVAPGGDPANDSDPDDLHWIENIWTSTPFDSKFAGGCTTDYPSGALTGGVIDCRTLIAGTSMATPIVAGSAALILAVNPAYQSPTKMKQLLCSTANDIVAAHEGCGRLNTYRAMATALGDPNPP
jgi:subtilisin family serine protease